MTVGPNGWVNPTSSRHGTTKLIASRNTRVRVGLVTRSNALAARLIGFIFVQRLSGGAVVRVVLRFPNFVSAAWYA